MVKSWDVKDSKDQNLASIAAIEWFESKLSSKLIEIDDHFKKYRISDALMTIYKLVWEDYCSWYLEILLGLLYKLYHFHNHLLHLLSEL